jgi:hypothetical protein
MAVSPDRFRRLAMSSPWRWRELTLLWQDGVDEPVRVAVGRPGRLRVEHLDGTVISQIDGPARVPGRVSWLRLGALGALATGGRDEMARPFVWDTEPQRDPEGLVVQRASWAEVDDGEMLFSSYRFPAAMDPKELASGVRLAEVTERVWRGRLVWEAVAIPEPTYEPRCTCCPLLAGAVSAALFETERSGVSVDPPRGLPEEEFFVRLDAQTAGCVHVSRLDGTDPRVRLDVAIEQVA